MNWKNYLKYLLLPLLIAAYPILFLYGHNASALQLSSLVFPLGATLLIAAVVYTGFYFLQRNPLTASLSAVVFVILYFMYGSIYHQLVKWTHISINQALLMTAVIALAVALGYLISLVKTTLTSAFQKVLLVGSAALVIYNLFGVTVPVEAHKALAKQPLPLPQALHAAVNTVEKKPDIYYIIFDEYAGFDSTRSYFHDSSIDQFQTFLNQNHFFVATGSRSVTLNTGSEIASRLNLQQYPEALPNQVKMDAIDHNKVMQVLKSYGYTTVVMDMAFQGIQADMNVQYDPEEVGGMAIEEFKKTFLDTTMFNPFSSYFMAGNQIAVRQQNMIMYSLNKTTNMKDVPGPKFVYTHVLLPHEPFIWDKDGHLLPPQASDDWYYYLGQHQYTTKLAEQMITKLLSQADPKNPPVIIVQSDHGARNLATTGAGGATLNRLLPNFPTEDMHDILNAMYLPGFDTSQLSNSMDPNETFVIVLNHYLNAGVKVDPNPAK